MVFIMSGRFQLAREDREGIRFQILNKDDEMDDMGKKKGGSSFGLRKGRHDGKSRKTRSELQPLLRDYVFLHS
jgi:hypothetical protein